VSPPYSGPDDGGDTDPYPLDKNQPPPGPQFPYGDSRHTYIIDFDVDITNNEGANLTYRGSIPVPRTNPGLEGPIQGYQIAPIQEPYYVDERVVWFGGQNSEFNYIWEYPYVLPTPQYNKGWRYSNIRNIVITAQN
jgi:hypothetical protein